MTDTTPQNLEAEKALLGALITLGEVPADVKVSSDDFFVERHAAIFSAIKSLQSPFDFITLSAALEQTGKLEAVGGLPYLAELSSACPFIYSYPEYAKIVHETGERRRMLHLASQIATGAFQGSIEDIYAAIENATSEQQPQDWQSQFIPPEELALPPTPTDWIIQNRIARGSLSIWFGSPGAKKSYILADAAVCVANGLPWLEGAFLSADNDVKPLNGIPTFQTPVLWIDLDNGRRITRNRFSAILNGHDATPQNLFPISMPSPWPFMDRDEPAKYLFDTIVNNDIGLVIIDNMGHITGEVDENTSEMAKVMSRLRRIVDATNAAIIVIHHPRKSGSGGQRVADAIRGSSSLEAALDYAFFIERSEDDPNVASISTAKVREGSWPPPLTLYGNFQNSIINNQDLLTAVSFHQMANPSPSRADAITLTLLNAISDSGLDGVNSVIATAGILWDFDDKSVSTSTWHKYITSAKAKGLISTQKQGRSKSLHLTQKGNDFILLNS